MRFNAKTANRSLFTAGVIAILIAITYFFAGNSLSSVSAHPCEDDPHSDFQATPVSCAENSHDNPHHQVGSTGGVDGGTRAPLTGNILKINISSSTLPFTVQMNGFTFDDSSNGHRITVNDSASDTDDDFISVVSNKFEISKATQITDGTIKVKDFTYPESPGDYPIRFFKDDNELPFNNILTVKNPISSTAPGDTVGIRLVTSTDVVVNYGEDITVDMDDFILPSSIDEDKIVINPNPENVERYNGPLSEVSISDSKIIFTLPSRPEGKEGPAIEGMYTIRFKQSAGIRNPTNYGEQTFVIDATDIAGYKADYIKATIKSYIEVEPENGTRNDDVIVSGRGFVSDQTATVYLV